MPTDIDIDIPKLSDVRELLSLHHSKKYKARSLNQIKSIAIHHSLTKSGNAESFARYHVNTNGWPGIGYHFVIEKNGTIKWCNSLTVKSYHVGNSNLEAIGICLTGDFRIQQPTLLQNKSLTILLKWLLNSFSLTPENVKGHSEYPGYANKACPCLDMDIIRQQLQPLKKKPSYHICQRTGLSKTSLGYTLGDIIDRMESKGYKVFKSDYKPYNLNLVGIRSKSRLPNKFDDTVGYFYRFENQWQFKLYKATTDPGLYYLNHPLNVSGTAILKADQYLSTYIIGLHRGRYKALKQCEPVTVYRDANRDDILDHQDKQQTGLFGINIHRASMHSESTLVNRWSAGCQVIADPSDFKEFMSFCFKAVTEWGPKFTYTLLED